MEKWKLLENYVTSKLLYWQPCVPLIFHRISFSLHQWLILLQTTMFGGATKRCKIEFLHRANAKRGGKILIWKLHHQCAKYIETSLFSDCFYSFSIFGCKNVDNLWTRLMQGLLIIKVYGYSITPNSCYGFYDQNFPTILWWFTMFYSPDSKKHQTFLYLALLHRYGANRGEIFCNIILHRLVPTPLFGKNS